MCRIKLLPPSILVAATKAVASKAPILSNEQGGLLPGVEDVRSVSVEIAAAVIKTAIKEGLSQVDDIPKDNEVLKEWIREQMWDPKYRPYEKVDEKDASTLAKGEAGTARTH